MFNPFWGNPFKKNKSDIDNDIDFLSTIPIFDSLSRSQKLKIFSIIHIRHYQEGEIIFRQEDPGVGLYIIRDGTVDIYSENPDFTKKKIANLNKGDFFGEISLLNETPRSATVVASQCTTLFGIFKPDMLSLMDSNPKLGLQLIYRLAQIVAERLNNVNKLEREYSINQ
jgi:CRP-like cAMP-binding protein